MEDGIVDKTLAQQIGEPLSGSRQNLSGDGVTSPLVATVGETFPDGSSIDLVRLEDGSLGLSKWDGTNETIGPMLEHKGRHFQPAPINDSVLRNLALPTGVTGHGSTRQFLAETCKLLSDFVGLDSRSASLVARAILCSAIVEALPTAPILIISGPDAARRERLIEMLQCLCRLALRLTAVTPAALCSLAGGIRFTFLVSQETISNKLQSLLVNASNRDQKIPYRGGLLDLFGVQVINSDSVANVNSGCVRAVEIAMLPSPREVLPLDFETKKRVTMDFQAKLLSFRHANFVAASNVQFNSNRFSSELRNLALSLTAATPDDVELQDDLFDFLRQEEDEIRCAKWTDSNNVALEAVLVARSEYLGTSIYVKDLAEIAAEILTRRGELGSQIDPAGFGKRLKSLGFVTSRDAKGKKLLITDAVLTQAEDLLNCFKGAWREIASSK